MRIESTPKKPDAAPARLVKTTKRLVRVKTVLARPAPPQGWDTSDEHELELRRWRGRTEITSVEALESEQPVFGAFRARSESGRAYVVEIRSLDGFDNSCGCIDHRVNGLGTCKHIEGVLAGLRRGGVRAFGTRRGPAPIGPRYSYAATASQRRCWPGRAGRKRATWRRVTGWRPF